MLIRNIVLPSPNTAVATEIKSINKVSAYIMNPDRSYKIHVNEKPKLPTKMICGHDGQDGKTISIEVL